MLQLRNSTPFAAALFLLGDERGVDTLFAAVKISFDLSPAGLRVAGEHREVSPVDAYLGDPARTSLRHASEAHLHKPGTDVLVLGEAHPPRGRAPRCTVAVRVGALAQEIDVVGDRAWTRGVAGIVASAPEPFERMPLIYERASGGAERLSDGTVLADERNPVGRGFLGTRPARALLGQPLPNLEDPRDPISSPGDAPAPVGFGPIAPGWLPRRARVGTYDEEWRARRAPHLPLDFDPAFFHVAPPAMQSRSRLRGGEPVELVNCSLAAPPRFALPTCAWDVSATIAGRAQALPMALETVLLELDRDQVHMTWRGAASCDKRALQVEEVRVALRSLAGARA